MKTKVLFIVMLAFGVVFMVTLQSFSQSGTDAELIKFYEACIQNQISKHQAKTALKVSRSENLRSSAVVSSKKAVFLVNHKDMLIQEMLKNEMDPKTYKVEHYLNRRYNELNHK